MKGRQTIVLGLVAVALFSCAPRAIAQEVPVVLVHGFKSSGETWEDTAARLHEALDIAVYAPDLSWNQPFETQARQLENQLQSVSHPIAVGHSNGGVISRAWSRSHPMAGLVTYGSPHLGAPLVQNAWDYLFFNSMMSAAFGNVYRAFGSIPQCTNENPDCDMTWLFALLAPNLTFVDLLRALAADTVFSSVGMVGAIAPVAYDMAPGAPYLNEINSPSNLAREASSVPVRVGIVSAPDDFYAGGVIRAAWPDHPEFVFVRDVVGIAIEGRALDILLNPYATPSQVDIAYSLENLSEFLLLGMDEWWCGAVSEGAGRLGCWANDGFVPIWSQDYAGFAAGVWPLRAATGPFHTQETRFEHSGPIRQALTELMYIPPRSAGGSADGSPCSPSSGMLCSGQDLRPGDRTVSPGGTFYLAYQSDGNLVRYGADGTASWAINCWPECMDIGPAGLARMQTDGNFVVYDANGTPRWWSGTDGHPGAYLRLSDDGALTVYGPGGETLWRLDAPASASQPSPRNGCPAGAGTLCGDQALHPGDRIVSPGGAFFLTYQSDGNLVRYRADNAPTWAINCWSACVDLGAPGVAAMQSDGNFVVYDADSTPKWWSGTDGHGGAYLVLDDAGVMTIYGPDGAVLWRQE